MQCRSARTSLVVVLTGIACAQTASFEVASIKPASPSLPDGRIVVGMAEPVGGPGSSDPGRIRYPVINLKTLLLRAYDLRDAHLVVGPEWLDSEYFQVEATMPPGTSKEQFEAMLQNLLAERFQLKAHRETKEVRGYALVVGKGGPNMKKFVEVPGATYPGNSTLPPVGRPGSALGSDGFAKRPLVPPGRSKLYQNIGIYGVRLTGQDQSMEALAGSLVSFVKLPVIDATGLTAKYNFVLTFVPEGARVAPSADPFPDLFSALQWQLGLKLERRQGTETTLVVDHIEKKPTAN